MASLPVEPNKGLAPLHRAYPLHLIYLLLQDYRLEVIATKNEWNLSIPVRASILYSFDLNQTVPYLLLPATEQVDHCRTRPKLDFMNRLLQQIIQSSLITGGTLAISNQSLERTLDRRG